MLADILAKTIKRKLLEQKTMPLDWLMQVVAEHYYQHATPFGAQGDFVTSPELCQIFGELLGVWCASVAKVLGTDKFILVELGPGKGTLMQDILRATRHIQWFQARIEAIHFIEVSESLKVTQQETLSPWKVPLYWHASLDTLPKSPAIVIANEFFDALPIKQAIFKCGAWYERYVALDEKGDVEFVLSGTSSVEAQLQAGKYQAPQQGEVLEWSPLTSHYIKELTSHIKEHSGAGIIIDYGYNHYGYGDTLQAIKDHRYQGVFNKLGTCDMSAHVNFAQLSDDVQQTKCAVYGPITQREFLLNMGINLRCELLSAKSTAEQKRKLQGQIDQLISPKAMGQLFKVMAFSCPAISMPPGFD